MNRILGNSDNHGMNLSILRHHGCFKLAPIHDLAPMVLDPEGVTRVTKWASEIAGAPDWRAVCGQFGQLMNQVELHERLCKAAHDFRALPRLLKDMLEEIRSAQSIPVNNLDARLKEWGLL